MIAAAVCALLFWLAPIGRQYWWTWTVVRDVRRGQGLRYSAEGYAQAGPSAMRAMLETLRDGTAVTRKDAAMVLGTLDLAEAALRDPDPDVRLDAMISLGQIGPGAAEAVEPLMQAVRQESDPRVLPTAFAAPIGRIGDGREGQ